MKKAISAVLAVLMTAAVAITAAGCGGSSSSEQQTTTTIPKATNASTAPTEAQTFNKYSSSNGTGSATVPRTTAPAATGEQSATTPTQSSGNTNMKDDPEAAKTAALNYYGTSEAEGSSVVFMGMETAPDGTWFYNAYVYKTDGSALPVFVAIDGSVCYDPESFYSSYGISPAIDAGSSSEAEPAAQASESSSAEYNEVEPYNGQ